LSVTLQSPAKAQSPFNLNVGYENNTNDRRLKSLTWQQGQSIPKPGWTSVWSGFSWGAVFGVIKCAASNVLFGTSSW
jgi:hypothetical protein